MKDCFVFFIYRVLKLSVGHKDTDGSGVFCFLLFCSEIDRRCLLYEKLKCCNSCFLFCKKVNDTPTYASHFILM